MVPRRERWLRENGPCQHCGSWENLEVDHIDPATKDAHTSSIWSWPDPARRASELAKCQVLCAPCHQRKTSRQSRCGEKNRHAKLLERDVLVIYRLYEAGVPASTIAKCYGVTRATVRRILRGDTWKHLYALHRPTAPKRDTCQRGHKLEGANLYISPRGQRGCARCNREHAAVWRVKKGIGSDNDKKIAEAWGLAA